MKNLVVNLYSLLQGKSRKVALAAMPSVVLIFSLLFMAASCEKWTSIQEVNYEYPIDIPFTEYSLEETSCQWERFNYNNGGSLGEVILINSDEELNQYVACTGDSYPSIDFSKYTLLLARGLAPSTTIYVNCNGLQQLSEQSYKMNIDLSLGNATVMTCWQVPIIIKKLSEESIVELVVTIKNDEQ